MQLDPEVNRRKFKREIRRLCDQQETLNSRGIFVLKSTTFPRINVFCAPRHPLQVLVPTLRPGSIILPSGPTTALVGQFESVAARAFKACFDLTDYDLRAPSVDFRDPWTDTPLDWPNMFRAFEFERERGPHPVLLDKHPMTGKPFLCLRGIREYHEHPQHSGDEWLLYREEMNLFSIIMSMWRVCIDLSHPRMVPTPNGPQVQWFGEGKA
jgi:hypothetical protein